MSVLLGFNQVEETEMANKMENLWASNGKEANRLKDSRIQGRQLLGSVYTCSKCSQMPTLWEHPSCKPDSQNMNQGEVLLPHQVCNPTVDCHFHPPTANRGDRQDYEDKNSAPHISNTFKAKQLSCLPRPPFPQPRSRLIRPPGGPQAAPNSSLVSKLLCFFPACSSLSLYSQEQSSCFCLHFKEIRILLLPKMKRQNGFTLLRETNV